MFTLQELLDLLAAGDADAIAAALASPGLDLTAMLAEARAQVDVVAASELDDDAVIALESLADSIDALTAETGRREVAAAERAQRVESIMERVTAPDTAETIEDTPTPVVEAEPAVEAEPVIEVTPELVTAAGRPRVDLAAISRRSPRPAPPVATQTPFSLVAAADVPGVPHGRPFEDMTDVAKAAIRQLSAMPSTPGQPATQRGLAVFNKTFAPDMIADGRNDQAVLDHAGDERRLSGNSLVAAGGWCAPSEILYEIGCERETMAGLLDIPDIQINRGGIRWTQGPDFSDMWTAPAFFTMTEAQAIAGTPKPCFEIPCDDFLECRLDAIGVCLTSGILQQRGYPELVARFIRGILVAHAHRVNAITIARIVAGSTPVALPAAAYAATIDVLAALDLQAIDYRTKFMMDPNATLEVVAPFWLKGVIRSDLSKRNAYDEPYMVSDAEMNAWFAARNLRVQFVYDWQTAYVAGQPNTIDGGFGGPVPATAWPTSVQVLMYAAGTWLRGSDSIIEIGTLYDSTLLNTNRYQALFSEESLCVIQRCADSRVITIPLCPSGNSGLQVAGNCAV